MTTSQPKVQPKSSPKLRQENCPAAAAGILKKQNFFLDDHHLLLRPCFWGMSGPAALRWAKSAAGTLPDSGSSTPPAPTTTSNPQLPPPPFLPVLLPTRRLPTEPPDSTTTGPKCLVPSTALPLLHTPQHHFVNMARKEFCLNFVLDENMQPKHRKFVL